MARPTTKTAQQMRAEKRDSSIKNANKKYKVDTKKIMEEKAALLAKVGALREQLVAHEETRDAAIAEAWGAFVSENGE